MANIEEKLKNNPFPTDSVDPKIKATNEYGLKVAKHIYWQAEQREILTRQKRRIQENRDMANNNQDKDQYKPRLNAAIDSEGKRTHMNISWDIESPAQKIVQVIHGGMMNQDHKCQFNAIDPISTTNFEKQRNAYYGKLIRQKQAEELAAETGMQIENNDGLDLSSPEEIELYMDMTYKQSVEIGMEEIVDFELYQNDWEKKIKSRVISDLIENAHGRVRLYFDENNKIRLRYTDIINYYESYSDETDSSDTEYEAERILYPIRYLRNLDTKNEITEAQWFEIAKLQGGKNGNAVWAFGDNYQNSGEYTGREYSFDDYRVEVLDFILYTSDTSKWEEKVGNNGRNRFDKKKYDYKSPKKSIHKRELVVKKKEMSYEGFWIIGTNHMLSYGKSKNILRYKDTTKKNALSPRLLHRYIGFRPHLRNGTSTSIIDVIAPNIHNIQILSLRKRHIVAEATPTGISVDIGGITDVMSLLKVESALDVISIYKQKGVMFHSRVDANGDPLNGSPIQELTNPFAEQLLAIDQSILSELNIIRQNTGINETRDGSSPDKDALVGIEKMRLLASNNTTRAIYHAFWQGILAPIGRNMSRMVQYKAEYAEGGIKEYESIISKQGVKSIEFQKDVVAAELGIKVEALPTAEEMQDFLNMLQRALDSGEIRPEDWTEAKSILNIKKANRYLISRRKIYAKEKMQEKQQQEEIIAQREQATITAQAESEAIRANAKAEAEINILTAKMRLEKELESHKLELDLQRINREGYWDERNIETAQENDSDSERGVPDSPRVMSNPVSAATRTDI